MNNNATSVADAPAAAPALTKAPSQAAHRGPRFEIDTSWPKPLPDGWIGGQLAGVCVDHDDNIIVTNRGDITKEEEETCIKAPAVLIFNQAGNLIDSWGDWELLPRTVHSCCVDADNNVWITANGDGMIQKYTRDGKLLLQIGKKGVYDTSDGTRNGTPLNSGHNALNAATRITVSHASTAMPAAMTICSHTPARPATSAQVVTRSACSSTAIGSRRTSSRLCGTASTCSPHMD